MLFRDIVDDRLRYEKVRELRWSEGVFCPHCKGKIYKRHRYHNSSKHRYSSSPYGNKIW